MTELRYALRDSALERFQQNLLHDAVQPEHKPRLSLLWLFFPEEYAGLAVWSLSVTCGLVWALMTATVTLMAMNETARPLADFFEIIYPGYAIPASPAAYDVFINLGLGLVYAFVYGCFFGFLLGRFYRQLHRPVPYGVRFQDRIKAGELVHVKRAGNNFPEAASANAYTVLIVANPFIQTSAKLIPNLKAALRPDPIMKEPELFQMKVASILAGFAQNKTLAPFFDRIRFIALFDPQMTVIKESDEERKLEIMRSRALCLESHIDVLIEPAQRVYSEDHQLQEERLREYLKQHVQLKRVDVVFAVTASHTHTRSSSRFSIEQKPLPGIADFTYTANTESKPLPGYYAAHLEVPGMVAYSAWDLSLSTPVHEFAHAMSSAVSGLIADEYHYGNLQKPGAALVLNKHYRQDETQEIPSFFARIEENGKPATFDFHTDKLRVRPERWISLVPQRSQHDIPCIMDEPGRTDEFDLLLQHFITRRLTAKMQQPSA